MNDLTEAKKATEIAIQKAHNYDDYSVSTTVEYDFAATHLKEIVAAKKELTEKRLELTRPLDQSKKKIMDMFRGPTETLEGAEQNIKNAMQGFQYEQEQKRLEAERKARAKAERERKKLEREAEKAAAEGREERAQVLQDRAEVVTPEPVAVAKPKAEGVSTQEVWKFEVTDPDAVPRSYLAIDETKIGKVVRALKGETEIPGIRVYSEKIMKVRA